MYLEQLVRQSGFEPPLTPLRYYALEERSGTGALIVLLCLFNDSLRAR